MITCRLALSIMILKKECSELRKIGISPTNGRFASVHIKATPISRYPRGLKMIPTYDPSFRQFSGKK
jgi:hypothetical protein